MPRSTFVYVTYIRTTPEKLWLALTDPEFMKQYWFGMHCESQWTAGSSWKLVSPSGQIYDAGEIVEADPPRRLRGSVRRLAESYFQPQVTVGGRLDRFGRSLSGGER
jgi:uncharacterized protein YndB with AHSA1/START domain